MLQIERLALQEAELLIEGATARAQQIGVPMCIAVCDESGTLITFRRMDGGKVSSVSIAMDKAFTAAVARKGTHVYNELCVPGQQTFGIHVSNGGHFCVIGGGMPITVNGIVVGGIGVSAGTPTQDMDCAQAGIDQFQAQSGLQP